MTPRGIEIEEVFRRHEPFEQRPKRPGHCQTHGDFESRNYCNSIWTGCPTCGEERRTREEQLKAAERAEQEALRWSRLLGDSCIPPRFYDRTFEGYTATNAGQQRAVEFARQLADDIAAGTAAGRCAVFVGRPGTGKSHLAAAVATHAMRSGRSAIFTTVTRLIRRIRGTYNRGSAETESQAVEVFTSPDLLILDEIGVQRGTDDEKMLLFDVLNDRYENRCSTVLLSNLPTKELRRYLGDRVFDRLKEDGGQVVVFDWESMRGQIGGVE
jgi:DNA replication protein DnaC